MKQLFLAVPVSFGLAFCAGEPARAQVENPIPGKPLQCPHRSAHSHPSGPQQAGGLLSALLGAAEVGSCCVLGAGEVVECLPSPLSAVVAQTMTRHDGRAAQVAKQCKEEGARVVFGIRSHQVPTSVGWVVEKAKGGSHDPQTCGTPGGEPVMTQRGVLRLLKPAQADVRSCPLTVPSTVTPNGQKVFFRVLGHGSAPCNDAKMEAPPCDSVDGKPVNIVIHYHFAGGMEPGRSMTFATSRVIPDGQGFVTGNSNCPRQGSPCAPVITRVPLVHHLFRAGVPQEREGAVIMMVTPHCNAQGEEQPGCREGCKSSQAVVLPGMTLPHCPGWAPAFFPPPPVPFPGVPAIHVRGMEHPGFVPGGPVTFVNAEVKKDVPVASGVSDKVANLLNKYHKACAEGDTAKAKKLAKKALNLDPTCFSKVK